MVLVYGYCSVQQQQNSSTKITFNLQLSVPYLPSILFIYLFIRLHRPIVLPSYYIHLSFPVFFFLFYLSICLHNDRQGQLTLLLANDNNNFEAQCSSKTDPIFCSQGNCRDIFELYNRKTKL